MAKWVALITTIAADREDITVVGGVAPAVGVHRQGHTSEKLLYDRQSVRCSLLFRTSKAN